MSQYDWSHQSCCYRCFLQVFFGCVTTRSCQTADIPSRLIPSIRGSSLMFQLQVGGCRRNRENLSGKGDLQPNNTSTSIKKSVNDFHQTPGRGASLLFYMKQFKADHKTRAPLLIWSCQTKETVREDPKHPSSAKTSKTESFLSEYESMLICFLSSGDSIYLLSDPSDASALLLCSRCASWREIKLAKRRRHQSICQKVTKVKVEKAWMKLKYCVGMVQTSI